MNIKDFRKGQSVCVLNMHRGYNAEPETHDTTVSSVGRKYVTVPDGRKYESSGDEYSLTEHTVSGSRTLLCPDMERARMYMERKDLRRWFLSAAQSGRKYTLGQLRKVKEILEDKEKRNDGE